MVMTINIYRKSGKFVNGYLCQNNNLSANISEISTFYGKRRMQKVFNHTSLCYTTTALSATWSMPEGLDSLPTHGGFATAKVFPRPTTLAS